MLEKFLEVKALEVKALREKKAAGKFPDPWQGKRDDFAKAISRGCGPVGVIAEYKRASPSLGDICPDLMVEDVARQYKSAGASALSILTEEAFFKGHFDFLARAANITKNQIPLLRKDFIIDPIQIEATAASPVSAVLLIARLTPNAKLLRDLRECAEKNDIQSVVEIFDHDDLDLARESGAKIIQVNARDLDTLKVDRRACLDLIDKGKPEAGETWIQASGVSLPEHLGEAADAGFNAVLVGTALMRGGQPGAALATLLAPVQAGEASHAD